MKITPGKLILYKLDEKPQELWTRHQVCAKCNQNQYYIIIIQTNLIMVLKQNIFFLFP